MSITNALRQADIFYELTPTQLELIASICREEQYKKGELIFAENSSSAELYLVVEGEVEIEIHPGMVADRETGQLHGPQKIATFRRGQSFGEVALLDEGRRSATARTTQNDTRLLAIPRDKLMNLCNTYPQLGYKLMYNVAVDLAMKIRNADLHIREQLLWSNPQQS